MSMDNVFHTLAVFDRVLHSILKGCLLAMYTWYVKYLEVDMKF